MTTFPHPIKTERFSETSRKDLYYFKLRDIEYLSKGYFQCLKVNVQDSKVFSFLSIRVIYKH